jgi:NarL family two-component system response regulator LiaR
MAHELTEREVEVLRLIAKGYSNRQIAQALEIGEETVKTHVANMLAKFEVDHRLQIVVYALKHGLLSLDDLTY